MSMLIKTKSEVKPALKAYDLCPNLYGAKFISLFLSFYHINCTQSCPYRIYSHQMVSSHLTTRIGCREPVQKCFTPGFLPTLNLVNLHIVIGGQCRFKFEALLTKFWKMYDIYVCITRSRFQHWWFIWTDQWHTNSGGLPFKLRSAVL